ncbi:hypothetical protein INR49_025156 [Caranx melampygus]|nr:hypothetical protein INR49_025156 [Caranx melampygus]
MFLLTDGSMRVRGVRVQGHDEMAMKLLFWELEQHLKRFGLGDEMSRGRLQCKLSKPMFEPSSRVLYYSPFFFLSHPVLPGFIHLLSVPKIFYAKRVS